MPKPKAGESEKDFVSRCIPIVMKDGTAKDNKQATAICYSMYEESKKSMKPKEMLAALKVGARNNQTDKQSIQDIHDASCDLGAECKPMDMNEGITAMLNGKKLKAMKDMGGLAYARMERWDIQTTCSVISQLCNLYDLEIAESTHTAEITKIMNELCQFMMAEIDEMGKALQEEEGENEPMGYYMNTTIPAQVKTTESKLKLDYVKSLGIEIPVDRLAVKYVSKNTILHPVFIWGDMNKADLEADFFTKSTDFWDEALKEYERPLTWEHGQDKAFEKFEPNPVIGKTMKFYDDDIARWAESVITTDKQYRKYIDQFIEEKRLGYSSDSAPQYVKRVKQGKAMWIKSWPWFGGSLTAAPCEPRMKEFTPEFLKSLGIALPDNQKVDWEASKAILDYFKFKYQISE